MPPSGGTRTSLSFAANSSLAMNAAFQPSSGLFSPGLPLTPTQPQPVRVFDFNVGTNTVITPRDGYGDIHSFASLRAYANVEPVRLAIETCKDQIERLDWQVKPTERNAAKAKKAVTQRSSDIIAVEKFFRKPDGETPFATWLRTSLEDLLVIDAPAFEKRRNRSGKLIGLDIVPGKTLKLLVDETGRRPKPPVPAYQQIIRGVVWNNLTTDDLIYSPRNPRPDHLYGLSPVEQTIVTINTVMRRQGVQLAYFTDSSVPAGILNVPAGWKADDIKNMQDMWDARTEGDSTQKSKLQWVPEGTKYAAFKEAPLKDEFDEWLYRIVCFAFSLPPTAFVKQMNRATAGQAADTGKEEGIESRKLWWKRIADDIIQTELGFPDLEWAWTDGAEVDAGTQSENEDRDLKNGSRTLNEVRDGRGDPPIEGGDQAMIYTATGPILVSVVVDEALNPPEPVAPVLPGSASLPPPAAGAGPGEPGAGTKQPANGEKQPQHPSDVAPKAEQGKPPKAKTEEFGSVVLNEPLAKEGDNSLSADRPLALRARTRLRKKISSTFVTMGHEVAAEVEAALTKLGKAADDSGDIAKRIAAAVDLSEFDKLIEALTDDLFQVAFDSSKLAIAQIGVPSSEGLVDQVNDRAVKFAAARAAEAVSLQGDRNIVEPTRDAIRDIIAKGLDDNIGSAAIADKIEASTAFAPKRAELIAKTEIANANAEGKLEGWRAAAETGLTLKKSWQVSNNNTCCDDCSDNEAAGAIDIDDDFPSGDAAEPAHPNCECVTTAEVVEPGDDDA